MATNQFTMPDDFASRYGDTLRMPPSLSVDPNETVQGREARLIGDISKSDDTVVSYAFNLNRRVDRIKSLLSTGDIEAARREYDDHAQVVSANRDGLLALAGLQNAGKTGERVAANSRYAAMAGIDSEKVAMMGRDATIGEILGKGSGFMQDQSEYAQRTLGFDRGQLDMYYGQKDGYDDVDRRMMKSCIDPFVSASGKDGAVAVENHIQIRSLARTVADNRDNIRAAFGSRSGDVVDFIIHSHAKSGGHSEALQSLIEIGKAYGASANLSAEATADKIIASYNELANSSFGPDKDGKYGELSGDQRRLFDTALLSSVNRAKGKNGTIDFQNPRFRRAFRVAMNEFAICMDYGVDLFAKTKDGTGGSPADALGEFIGAEALGETVPNGNVVRNMRGFRQGVQALITGGDDFEPSIGDNLTGRAGTRNTVAGRLGGSSSCPGADALASAAHEYLLREFTADVVSHNDIGKALRRRVLSGKGRRDLVNGLASYYAPSFSGSGAVASARALADRTIAALTSGEPMNMQTVITELGSNEEFAMANPSAAKSFTAFLRSNVMDGELSAMRQGLVQHGLAAGMSEPEAQYYATQQVTGIQYVKRTGGNYRLQYNRTMRSGPMYTPMKDVKGRPAHDPETGLPAIARTFVNFDDATGGRFFTDTEYAAKMMGDQQAFKELYRTGLDAKAKAVVARAKQ